MFQWIIEKFLVRYKKEIWFKMVATVLMALILGLEYGVQNGLISGTAEWLARTIQVASIVKAFLSQVDWELPTNGPDLPKGFWTILPLSLIVALGLTVSSFKQIELPSPPAPSFEMYSFLKESNSFHQAFKGVADELCQTKIAGISTATTVPLEVAKLKLAKAILSGGSQSQAFNFVLNECFSPTNITNLNDYNNSRDEFYNALDNKFDNLAERW